MNRGAKRSRGDDIPAQFLMNARGSRITARGAGAEPGILNKGVSSAVVRCATADDGRAGSSSIPHQILAEHFSNTMVRPHRSAASSLSLSRPVAIPARNEVDGDEFGGHFNSFPSFDYVLSSEPENKDSKGERELSEHALFSDSQLLHHRIINPPLSSSQQQNVVTPPQARHRLSGYCATRQTADVLAAIHNMTLTLATSFVDCEAEQGMITQSTDEALQCLQRLSLLTHV